MLSSPRMSDAVIIGEGGMGSEDEDSLSEEEQIVATNFLVYSRWSAEPNKGSTSTTIQH